MFYVCFACRLNVEICQKRRHDNTPSHQENVRRVVEKEKLRVRALHLLMKHCYRVDAGTPILPWAAATQPTLRGAPQSIREMGDVVQPYDGGDVQGGGSKASRKGEGESGSNEVQRHSVELMTEMVERGKVYCHICACDVVASQDGFIGCVLMRVLRSMHWRP